VRGCKSQCARTTFVSFLEHSLSSRCSTLGFFFGLFVSLLGRAERVSHRHRDRIVLLVHSDPPQPREMTLS
jgi:multisubunit Na+/H+ antiporter MnhE subunit